MSDTLTAEERAAIDEAVAAGKVQRIETRTIRSVIGETLAPRTMAERREEARRVARRHAKFERAREKQTNGSPAPVAQQDRAPVSETGGRGFESRPEPQPAPEPPRPVPVAAEPAPACPARVERPSVEPKLDTPAPAPCPYCAAAAERIAALEEWVRALEAMPIPKSAGDYADSIQGAAVSTWRTVDELRNQIAREMLARREGAL